MVPLEYIPLGAFGVATLILLGWVVYLHTKVSRLLKGKDAKSLEDTILALIGEMKELKEFQADSEKYLMLVERRLGRSVRGVATVRFNAFKGDGSGGNQSFATAFLDEHGSGAIISSIYSRERTSVFAKPVAKFVSEYDLSAEEKQAIELSKKSLETK